MLTFTGISCLRACKPLVVKSRLDTDSSRGFEPDIIPAAMLTQRIMGIMAHWREYTREYEYSPSGHF